MDMAFLPLIVLDKTTPLTYTCSFLKKIMKMYLSFHPPSDRSDDSSEAQLQRAIINDELDARFGFDRYKDPAERVGWLINMHPVKKFVMNIFDFTILTKDFHLLS